MGKASVARAKRKAPQRIKPFKPLGLPKSTPAGIRMEEALDALGVTIGAFIRERFRIDWTGDWEEDTYKRYGADLGADVAAWITEWSTAHRVIKNRKLDKLRGLAERAAIHQEQHAPESPLDRVNWARRHLGQLGRRRGTDPKAVA
jgi:hypothetical protein